MPVKTARLLNNGGSQAARLPLEFRFEGDEFMSDHPLNSPFI